MFAVRVSLNWLRKVIAVALLVCISSTQTSCFFAVANPKLDIPSWTTEDFYRAIEQNDVAQVQQYLSDKSRATKEFLSYYLLDYALELERNEVAQLMIEAGAGISTLSAVQHGNLSIVEELLNHGVEPRGVSLAAESGNIQLVKMLLDHGETKINTEGVARNGQVQALKLLLEAGAEPRGLCAAVRHGHENAAELLLEAGADANEIARSYDRDLPWDYLSPLHCAVINGSVKQVELLLEFGANPNISPHPEFFAFDARERDRSWTPLLELARDPELKNDEIVALLEEITGEIQSSKAEDNFDLEAKLYQAADNWDYDRVTELLEMGATPSGFGSFYLERSERYDPRVIEAFFEAGASPLVYNLFTPMYGPTALTLQNGDLDNFKRFISVGRHSEPLTWSWYMKIACVNGLTEAIELIWEQGWPRNPAGPTAISINYGHVHMIEFMLARGARPDQLRRAVESEQNEIVRMLLEAGADPNEPDEYDERSILEVALEEKNESIVGMLKLAGAYL